jgi:hypothetical protein
VGGSDYACIKLRRRRLDTGFRSRDGWAKLDIFTEPPVRSTISSLPSPHRIAGERLINQLTNTVSGYEATGSFNCDDYTGIDRY